MAGFDDPALFGDRPASRYDRGPASGVTAEVNFLRDLADGGRALELVIDAGRVGPALASVGVPVDEIALTGGDPAGIAGTLPYRLVFLISDMLFRLTTAERQAECFRRVSRALEPGGAFVIEAFVPDVTELDREQRVEASSVTEESATIQVFSHDPIAQRYDRQTITFSAEGLQMVPTSVRYSYPSEIDLMARLAGFQLAQRYADWQRRPFDAGSRSHISVYRI